MATPLAMEIAIRGGDASAWPYERTRTTTRATAARVIGAWSRPVARTFDGTAEFFPVAVSAAARGAAGGSRGGGRRRRSRSARLAPTLLLRAACNAGRPGHVVLPLPATIFATVVCSFSRGCCRGAVEHTLRVTNRTAAISSEGRAFTSLRRRNQPLRRGFLDLFFLGKPSAR